MTGQLALPALMLVLAAPVAVTGSQPTEQPPVELAQLTIHERIVIRVPRMMVAPTATIQPAPLTWKEKGGPRCIASGDLAGALVTEPSAVDLVLQGGKRVRAKLAGDCRPLDFYSGFYLRRSADGQVCAGRDAVRARSGATCPISRFRTLVADVPKR